MVFIWLASIVSGQSQTLVSEAKTIHQGISLDASLYNISLNIYIESDISFKQFYTRIDEGWLVQQWDVSELKSGEWHLLTQELFIDQDINNSPFVIEVPNMECTVGSSGSFYIDDISITNDNVSAATNLLSDQIALYPNPVRGKLNIQCPINSHITISNINGQFIQKYISNRAKNNWLNTAHLADGLYFVTIVNDNNSITKRIVVKH